MAKTLQTHGKSMAKPRALWAGLGVGRAGTGWGCLERELAQRVVLGGLVYYYYNYYYYYYYRPRLRAPRPDRGPRFCPDHRTRDLAASLILVCTFLRPPSPQLHSSIVLAALPRLHSPSAMTERTVLPDYPTASVALVHQPLLGLGLPDASPEVLIDGSVLREQVLRTHASWEQDGEELAQVELYCRACCVRRTWRDAAYCCKACRDSWGSSHGHFCTQEMEAGVDTKCHRARDVLTPAIRWETFVDTRPGLLWVTFDMANNEDLLRTGVRHRGIPDPVDS
jgi:hypothetical protein